MFYCNILINTCFTAACLPFGELGTVVPKSGGLYIFLQTAFRTCHPFFGELPAFIYFWITYTVIFPSATAVNAILFSEYSYEILQMFVNSQELCDEVILKSILGASAILIVGALNCASVKLYIKSQDILTYTKMTIIVFIVGCGVYMFISGKSQDFDPGFKGTNLSFYGLSQALYFGLYAYDGGNFITGITEEIKNPEKNIIYSLLISMSIVITTYLSLNITFLTVLSPAEIENGTTVISDFADKLFGQKGCVVASGTISLCLLLSIMCGIFYCSRVGYVAAREGHIAEILCCTHKTTKTPIPAVVVLVIISLLWFFSGQDLALLIDMFGFFSWLTYGFTMVALFVLRRKFPDAYRPFRVPSAIPVIVIFISFSLVVMSVLLAGLHLILIAGVCMSFITLLYYIFVYRAFRIKYFDTFQKNLQIWFRLESPYDEIKS
ncbi:cystine/glutamate transporter-like isoform X1 [Homalodisca vitripennis]|uniref:cystine/glutamate transporter-like isoform X1 n=1 Tax=Homalodisca vitripennis TaxID=197043 RepID=UPI001EEC8724|nr:cystine/glutamate transporter-like isoform X1 [Homalodisca vitripennis]